MSRDIQAHEVQYQTLPAEFREDMRLYIERGIRPGPFLQAILDNSLSDALSMAALWEHERAEKLALIERIQGWVFGQCPIKAFGGVATVDAWCKRGGLLGRTDADFVRERAERIANRLAEINRERLHAIGGAQNLPAFQRFMGEILGGKK